MIATTTSKILWAAVVIAINIGVVIRVYVIFRDSHCIRCIRPFGMFPGGLCRRCWRTK